ncbi:MAG: hypothetical protein ACM3JD_01210, partial [Rudaea sp.]
ASRLGEGGAAEEQLADQYAYAGAAFTYLVDTYGQDQTLAFYRSYTEVPISQVRTRARYYLPDSDVGALFQDLRVTFTEDAAKRFFGSSVAELDSAVQDWIRAQ